MQDGPDVWSDLMSRKASTFRQTDITRAVKAVVAAGVEVARIKIAKDGSIEIDAGKPVEIDDENQGLNEWDRLG
jgi:hypothetical protein